MSAAQHPVEIILARGLMSNLTTPAFLVDSDGNLVYYNDAAGELLGLRFEEAGPMQREEWATRFEPLGPDGKPIDPESLPLVIALRRGRRVAYGDAHPAGDRRPARPRGERVPDHRNQRAARRDGDLLVAGGQLMRVKVWGARGSIPSPGAGDRSLRRQHVVRTGDAVGRQRPGARRRDRHPQPRRAVRRAGPPDPHPADSSAPRSHPGAAVLLAALPAPGARDDLGARRARRIAQDRISRYLSAPLTPVEVRELPCELDFRDCPGTEWDLGPARIRAEAVNHRGPTLGFHISDGDATLCYIPDHEPALAGPLDELEPEWLSGYSLARDVDLLIHDCQYTDAEYAGHVGWGHSALGDALRFARRANARHTLLFHHDPHHSDEQLDAMLETAVEISRELGGSGTIELAAEQRSIDVLRSAVRAPRDEFYGASRGGLSIRAARRAVV